MASKTRFALDERGSSESALLGGGPNLTSFFAAPIVALCRKSDRETADLTLLKKDSNEDKGWLRVDYGDDDWILAGVGRRGAKERRSALVERVGACFAR